MDYFVGENVYTFNSGTEFSQFDRLKAFNQDQKNAVLLTRNYNRLAGQDEVKHNVNPDHVINMYDYFQGTTNIKRKEQSLRLLNSIPLKDYHIVGIDNNKSEITYHGKRIGLIHVMPATVGLIGSIEYYDSLGQTAVTEYWDWRGFKSMVETYHPDGSVAMQQYFNLEGKPVLEVTHMYIGKKVLPTMWKLFNYKGRDRQFRTENELFTFFLDELNADNPGVVVSDRRTLDEAVLNSKNAKKKVAYIHSVPFLHWNRPTEGILPAYEVAIKGINGNRFDEIVVPTQQQANDMKNAIDDLPSIVVADDSYVPKVTKHKKLDNNINLVYVGRLSEEKNIVDLIKAFGVIHQEKPEVKLKLQGYYSNQSYREKIEKLINDLKLTDSVEVVNYNAKKTVAEDATLFLNTSNSEGFGMNLLKSMSYGTPVVTYGVPYVQGNLVIDGKNGKIIKNRVPNHFAHRVLKLLNNDVLYESLSAGAIKTAENHNRDKFMKSWSAII